LPASRAGAFVAASSRRAADGGGEVEALANSAHNRDVPSTEDQKIWKVA